MDCVRSARRLGAGEVSLIYRRTKDQMPADREEVHAATSEGVRIVELVSPESLRVEDGTLRALVCTRNEYRGDRDSSNRKIPHGIPDTEFEIELDTLILAISQYAILDFFGDEVPDLTVNGYIATDDRFATSIPGLYAIGDVSAHGPQSIVMAAGDGKTAAESIIAEVTGDQEAPSGPGEAFDLQDLLIRRSQREYRTPITQTPLDARDNFDETIVTFTPEQAMAEAARCLDCHDICSLCVGVCPNMALMTYEMEPLRFQLPALTIESGSVVSGELAPWSVTQTHQIAVLSDFCNECGNCVTFCPTSGEPYKDKPRLYLNRAEFEAEPDNAFMMFNDGVTATLEGRFAGETHRIELNGSLSYTSPALTATLDPADFSLLEASAGDGVPSLQPAAEMYAVLSGLRHSMPHIPTADGGEFVGIVSHPGYEE
jgi:putative selenate reductase